MKKILITGYFGFQNAGDELILESIISSLKKEIPQAEVSVLFAKPSLADFENGIKAVNRWNPFAVLGAIIKSDVLISAGGLYQDATGTFSLYYYLALIIAAKISGKKIALYGVDFTPVRRRINRMFLKMLMPLADKINVRTEGSYKFLEKLGLSKKTTLSADAVLLIGGGAFGALTARGGSTEKIRRIGIIPRNNGNLRQLVELCNALAGRFEAEILFVPFHLERDYQFSKKLAAAMDFPSRITRWQKPGDLFRILGETDFIISQRLHGLIIGTMLGIPSAGISNDHKLEFYSREIGQKFIRLSDMDTNVTVGIVNDVWQWREEFKKLIDNNLPKLKYRSYLNVKSLLELL